jgi:predicted transcriptional regulator
VATKVNRDESHASRTVSDLEEKGFVRTERDGRYKRVNPSDARAVELYQDLVRQHAHVDFPELLGGVALEVLYYFDRPRSVSELAERSGNYRNTVNRVLKRLQERGIVGTDGGEYRFNADFGRLHEFARALDHHCNRRRLKKVAPNGTILWESADEFLAQTETEVTTPNFLERGRRDFRTTACSCCSRATTTTSTPTHSRISRRRTSVVTRF